MPYKILVIPGDGIGPEVVEAALYVIKSAAAKYGVLQVEYVQVAEGSA